MRRKLSLWSKDKKMEQHSEQEDRVIKRLFTLAAAIVAVTLVIAAGSTPPRSALGAGAPYGALVQHKASVQAPKTRDVFHCLTNEQVGTGWTDRPTDSNVDVTTITVNLQWRDAYPCGQYDTAPPTPLPWAYSWAALEGHGTAAIAQIGLDKLFLGPFPCGAPPLQPCVTKYFFRWEWIKTGGVSAGHVFKRWLFPYQNGCSCFYDFKVQVESDNQAHMYYKAHTSSTWLTPPNCVPGDAYSACGTTTVEPRTYESTTTWPQIQAQLGAETIWYESSIEGALDTSTPQTWDSIQEARDGGSLFSANLLSDSAWSMVTVPSGSCWLGTTMNPTFPDGFQSWVTNWAHTC
jgi:hypothetical protein